MAKDARDDGALKTPVAASLAHLLHRAQQAGADLHAGLLASAGLTVRQLAVLQALAASPVPLSQSGLVAATGIDRSTLAEMVARMEARGLVARASAETDRRAKTVSLAEAGETALATASGLAASADSALLKRIPKKHRELFLELLHRITLPLESQKGDKADKPAKAAKSGKKNKKTKGAAVDGGGPGAGEPA